MKRVSLKEHVDALLREKDRYIDAMLRERDKAITSALEQNEKRLAALNELRGDVATKTQVEALKERIDRTEGHSGGLRDGWGWIVGVIGILVGGISAWSKWS